MSLVVAKGNIPLSGTLSCTPGPSNYSSVVSMNSSFGLSYINSTDLNINIRALNVTWAKGTTYSLVFDEGFAVSGAQLSPQQTISLTTPSTDPSISNSTPANNATGVLNNVNLIVTFDREIFLGSGTVKIYKVGVSDPVYTIPTSNTSRLSVQGNQLTINTTGQLQVAQSYNIVLSLGSVVDKYNFKVQSTTIHFTMANDSSLREISNNIDDPRKYVISDTKYIFGSDYITSNQPGWTYTSSSGVSYIAGWNSIPGLKCNNGTSYVKATRATSYSYTGSYTLEGSIFLDAYEGAAGSFGYVFDTRSGSSGNGVGLIAKYPSGSGDYGSMTVTFGPQSNSGRPSIDFDLTTYGINYFAINVDKINYVVTIFVNGQLVRNVSIGSNNYSDLSITTSNGITFGATTVTGSATSATKPIINDFQLSKGIKYTSNYSPESILVGTTTFSNSGGVGDVDNTIIGLHLQNNSDHTFPKKFTNSLPYITDLDIDAGITYTIIFSYTGGIFYQYSDATMSWVPTNNSISYSGTKDQVNSWISLLQFNPGSSVTSLSISYTLKKNNITRETGSFSASGLNPSTI